MSLKPAITRSKKPKKTNAEYLQENSSNWFQTDHDGFHLPGTKEKRSTCGEWAWKGCNNIKGHEGITFNDTDCTNKGYATNFQMCCFRADCEYCWLTWSYRQASKATRRFEKYQELSKTKYKPRHIIISVPDWDYGKSKKELSKMARDKLNSVIPEWSTFGGCIIFHPFRNQEIDGKFRWYYAPHFHVLGYGWILPHEDSKKKKAGWIIKTVIDKDKDGNPIERSTFQTLSYQLTHAGIKKSNHTLTWFGQLSYRNCLLQIEDDYEKGKCPICEKTLSKCKPKNEFSFRPPDSTMEFIIDLDKWEFITNEEYYQQVGVRLPYTNGNLTEEQKKEKRNKKKLLKNKVKKKFRTLSLKYWMKNSKHLV